MGINKSMSHFKRVWAVCCTKTLSGGDGVLVDNKDWDFEFCHFKIKSGWWFRCKKECNHLQIEENILYFCFFISNRKEITAFNAVQLQSQTLNYTQATLKVLEKQTHTAEASTRCRRGARDWKRQSTARGWKILIRTIINPFFLLLLFSTAISKWFV